MLGADGFLVYKEFFLVVFRGDIRRVRMIIPHSA